MAEKHTRRMEKPTELWNNAAYLEWLRHVNTLKGRKPKTAIVHGSFEHVPPDWDIDTEPVTYVAYVWCRKLGTALTVFREAFYFLPAAVLDFALGSMMGKLHSVQGNYAIGSGETANTSEHGACVWEVVKDDGTFAVTVTLPADTEICE